MVGKRSGSYILIVMILVFTMIQLWLNRVEQTSSSLNKNAASTIERLTDEDRPLSRLLDMRLVEESGVIEALEAGYSLREVELYLSQNSLPILLPKASGNTLDGYLALAVNIMSETVQDEPEACVRWATGKRPDIADTDKYDAMAEDFFDSLVMGYSPDNTDGQGIMDDALFKISMVATFDEMGQGYGWDNLNLNVLTEPEGTFSSEENQKACFTMIAFLGEIQKMPEEVRYPFLRKLFS